MAVEARNEGLARKALAQHLVEEQQGLGVVAGEDVVGYLKIGVVIQHIERGGHFGYRQTVPAERDHLVEHRQGITHSAIGFLGDDVQRFVVIAHSLLRSDVFEVFHRIFDSDAIEVVNLTTGQNRRDNFVLFGGCQDKDGMSRRFFQGLQKGVEGLQGEHVHFVDDIDAVTSDLRGNTDLIGQVTDVVHRVVGGGIQLMDIERAALVEGTAGFAFVAGFSVGGKVLTVDRLGEDAGAGGFPYPSRSAEQIGMRQLRT